MSKNLPGVKGTLVLAWLVHFTEVSMTCYSSRKVFTGFKEAAVNTL